ncbi:RNA-directed DNA polymerase, eukaryota, reverse transcriptase zinc-binding domain protein, partial [Tanacetum coccineum]
SVLVNGSPTKEFKIERGLRQGDPLSPFLFIIAVEALHVTLQEAKSRNVFNGVKVSQNKLDISHLQFADDALIMATMNKACNWEPIIEKFHNKLSSWKATNLSYGGRLTLIKSVLGALGVYFFSLFKAPKGVVSYLEKLRRNLFWGGTLNSNKSAYPTKFATIKA